METSEQINELAAALCKTQGSLSGAKKDSANPFFKSTYADLESVWTACREALAKNNLSVVQTISGGGDKVQVSTMLAHSSGQWIRDTMALTPKDSGPQAMGSCISYGRRYALAAMVGVYQTDDDAEIAQGRRSDAKGDYGKGIDPKVAAAKADEFRVAFELDVDEAEIAQAVFKVHERIANDEHLYTAVGEQLNAKERAAIKEYVRIARVQNSAMMANGRAR